MTPARVAFLLLAFAPAPQPRPSASLSDWPCWRGADRSGVSRDKGLLPAWPAEGPRLLWTIEDLGEGYSAPSIVGDHVFVMGTGGNDELLLAYSAKDGKRLWSAKLGKMGDNKGPRYPGPKGTPSADGAKLYALGSDGDLVCASIRDGTIAWRKHLRTDFDGVPGSWGYSESVLIDGNTLVCTPGGRKAAILGLDKTSGRTLWQTTVEGTNAAGSSSPVVAQVGKTRLSVHFMAGGLVGVDVRTGKRLWSHTKNLGTMSAATPIVRGTDLFHTASSRSKGGDLLLRMTGDDKGVSISEVYLKRNVMNAHGGMVHVGECVYGTNDQGELMCLDFKTGDVRWRHRSVGRGSLVVADGRIYLRGEAGQMVLAEVNAERYVQKGQFTQSRRSKIETFAHPVVAGGRLYLRDGPYLFCYDLKGK